MEKNQDLMYRQRNLRPRSKLSWNQDVDSVRVLIRYDVENVSDETFEKACNGIFSEPPVDTLYKEEFQAEEGSKIFSVEFLPGQFDQRADSAVQCIQFIKEDEQPVIRTATTYVIHGGNGTVSMKNSKQSKSIVLTL